MITIHKSHSRTDLIDLINTINLPVVFSHTDNKKDIQDKMVELLQNEQLQKPFHTCNVYNLKNYRELRFYLKTKNPKKILNVKEKADIMKICKHIIAFCNHGYSFDLSNYYKDKQHLVDDMNYIKQFGDIPSVRRCCKLVNVYQNPNEKFEPMISPQVKYKISQRIYTQSVIHGKLIVNRGEHILTFD